MTENMIASIHQRMKNLSPTGVAEMFGRTGMLNPRVVNAPPQQAVLNKVTHLNWAAK